MGDHLQVLDLHAPLADQVNSAWPSLQGRHGEQQQEEESRQAHPAMHSLRIPDLIVSGC